MSKITKLNEIEKIIKDPFFYYADEKNKPALMKKCGQANNTVAKLNVIEEYIIGLKEEEEEDEDFEYLDNLITAQQSKQKIAEEAAAAKKKEEAAKKKEEAAKKKEEEAAKKKEEEAAKKKEEVQKERKKKEDEEEEEEKRKKTELKTAEIAKRIEDHNKASEKAEAEKKQKDERLLAEANDIALGFKSKFNIFRNEIIAAKNKESVKQSLSKAKKYFNETNTKLNEISKNIGDESNKAPIKIIQSGLESAYNSYGFEDLATVRIDELKIKEEERKLWSTEGFNENFQRIWEEFKTVYEQKIQPDLIMNENSKKFIEQFKTLIIFFSTCDTHLRNIITKIESIPIKVKGTPHPFESTLLVFNKIKYIFGYNDPLSQAPEISTSADYHDNKPGNAFVLKFFEFFRKITDVKFENNDISLSANLVSGTGIEVNIKIALSNLTTWLGKIYNEYIKEKRSNTERKLIGPIATLNNLDENIRKNIPGAKKVITILQEEEIKKYIRTFISDDLLNLMNQKFFLTSDSTIPSLPSLSELPSTTSEKFKRIFTIAPITNTEIGNITRECKPSTTSIRLGGNKTKKLKRKQIFSKTHKNISSHNNGTANRFHRGQHRSRKNHHIHQITVRKY